MRMLIGIIIAVMTLGSGALMLLYPQRFRDEQVEWLRSARGVWAFRLLGAALVCLALLGFGRILSL